MLYKEIDVRGSDDPVAEALDRVSLHFTGWEAYDRLYGPHTRSGTVTVIEPQLVERWLWDASWEWLEWVREEVEMFSYGVFGHDGPVLRIGRRTPAGWQPV